MTVSKKIKIGKKHIRAFLIALPAKNFILLKGKKGYVACGYWNLAAANKFNDVAVKISGVATLKEALSAKAQAVSRCAKKLGISKDQPVKDVLKILA